MVVFKVDRPPSPLNNVKEKDEHVPRTAAHFFNTSLLFNSFFANIAIFYSGDERGSALTKNA